MDIKKAFVLRPSEICQKFCGSGGPKCICIRIEINLNLPKGSHMWNQRKEDLSRVQGNIQMSTTSNKKCGLSWGCACVKCNIRRSYAANEQYSTVIFLSFSFTASGTLQGYCTRYIKSLSKFIYLINSLVSHSWRFNYVTLWDKKC